MIRFRRSPKATHPELDYNVRDVVAFDSKLEAELIKLGHAEPFVKNEQTPKETSKDKSGELQRNNIKPGKGKAISKGK